MITIVKHIDSNGRPDWAIGGAVPDYFTKHTFTSAQDARAVADFYITRAMGLTLDRVAS